MSHKVPASLRLLGLIEKLGAEMDIGDRETLAEAAQTAQRLESGEGFSAKGIVSLRDGKPYLDCTWMGMLAQITPEQALSIGLWLIQTAAEAESDAALLRFFRETGIDDERAAAAMAIVREERAKFQEVVGERQEPARDGLAGVIPFGKPS